MSIKVDGNNPVETENISGERRANQKKPVPDQETRSSTDNHRDSTSLSR